MFFEFDNNIIKSYSVRDGVLAEPYISPCQLSIPSPIQINSTGFCNEDEDDYGCGMIPQYYQGELYQGMSYTFNKEGKCVREICTDEEGISVNQLHWFTESNQLYQLDLNLPNENYVYSCGSGRIGLFYRKWNDKYEVTEQIHLEINPKNNRLAIFDVLGKILTTKSYLNCPVPLPIIFDLLDKEDYLFDDFIALKVSEDKVINLYNIWIHGNKFKHVGSMYATGLNGLENIKIFDDKNIFPNLQELRVNKEGLSTQKIEEFNRLNLKVVIT